MISVKEALDIILAHPFQSGTEQVSLMNSVGRVSGAFVFADRDLPPYNRVAMDGIAVRFEDLSKGLRKFKVAGIAIAGIPGIELNDAGTAIEVMTGAVLPSGSDVVIRYEDLRNEGDHFNVLINEFKIFQNVHRKGSDAKHNEELLKPGIVISPAEIPLMASVGVSAVTVKTLPRIGLISTGDELVEIDEQPLAHQIRTSNVYAIMAGLKEAGAVCSMYHLGDQDPEFQQKLDDILSKCDVVILSGGVSKGKLDRVPEALERAGIKKQFHQVAQRPGKPLWFGTGGGKIVFALPGNPVSVFLCLYKYIRPWLLCSMNAATENFSAVLDKDFVSDLPLTHFLQVRVHRTDGVLRAMPVPGGGSGDFANLRHISGFLELPPGAGLCSSGRAFPFIPIR
ncbi:MAG: molybdopterin molybdotransferase MoeA [Cyclobacteriaceae bacterium]